ncbi:MAG: DUF1640 domain-containing protein [Geminicoccaceae bacterium]|nr:DUF1640 domain-containing protein [Geminicoccaceae bacterium]
MNALDTHEIVKELMAAGFSDVQAEAVTRVVKKAQDVDLGHLATKADLAEAKGEIVRTTKADLAEAKTEILRSTRADLDKAKTEIALATRADIAEAKSEIIKWMFGTIGFQTLVIVGAVIALARVLQG